MATRSRSAHWLKLGRLRRARRVRNSATLGLVVLGPALALATIAGVLPATVRNVVVAEPVKLSRKAVRDGKLLLMLSDRYLKKGYLPVHALLATGEAPLPKRGSGAIVWPDYGYYRKSRN